MKATVMMILVFGLIAQQGSWAQGGKHPFMFYGPTEDSCGLWLSSTGPAKEVLQAWMLGFVSGADFLGDTPLAETDPDAIHAWVDKYCREHPVVSIATAAMVLVAELGGTTTPRRQALNRTRFDKGQ